MVSLGTDSTAGSALVNGNANSYISWNWKMGTTSGLSGGTITPTAYSINAAAGFGVYEYTGTGSAGTIHMVWAKFQK